MFAIRHRSRPRRSSRFVPVVDGLSSRIAPAVLITTIESEPLEAEPTATEPQPVEAEPTSTEPTSTEPEPTATSTEPTATNTQQMSRQMRDSLTRFYAECKTTGISI